jgi:FtsZ-interacting cell division protein ZipA
MEDDIESYVSASEWAQAFRELQENWPEPEPEQTWDVLVLAPCVHAWSDIIRLSKTKGFIKQRLSLLKLAPQVQEAVRRRDIDFSAARALGGLPLDEQVQVLDESIAEETEARKTWNERRAKMADLPGVKRAKIYDPLNDDEEEEEEEEVEEEVEKIRKPRQSKNRPDPKAKTSTVKRVTRRRKREKAAATGATKPVEERLAEKTKEWVIAFIDDFSSGKGLDESSTPQQVRSILKKYTAFLLERRALVLR